MHFTNIFKNEPTRCLKINLLKCIFAVTLVGNGQNMNLCKLAQVSYFVHVARNEHLRETPIRVLLQTVKTQMKCHIMRHFISTLFVKVKKIFRQKKCIFFLK